MPDFFNLLNIECISVLSFFYIVYRFNFYVIYTIIINIKEDIYYIREEDEAKYEVGYLLLLILSNELIVEIIRNILNSKN